MAHTYTVVRIVNQQETVILETKNRKKAAECFSEMQTRCEGRLRVDHGPILLLEDTKQYLRGKIKAPRTVGAVMKGQETDITNIITPERSESNV